MAKLSYKVWGKVHGNNLLEKGYFDGNLGLDSNEPWFYIPSRDIWWSAFDIEFIPDNEEEFKKAYLETIGLNKNDPH